MMNDEEDYKFARDQYYDLALKGSDAIDHMYELAKALDHPRAFEVLATMLKQNAEITEKLIDLKKKKKDIEKEDTPPLLLGQGGVTNNNVFVGSTAELQKFLQKEEAKSEIIDGRTTQETDEF